MTRITFAIATVLSLAFTPVVAQDFLKGYDAYGVSDYASALKEWRPLAEQGDALAQAHLGNLYYNGQGVPADHDEASRWYQLAALQGYAYAQNNLGRMYETGIYHVSGGVPQDYAEAVRWYRLAADQGYDMAQTNLGYMYEDGYGVPQDNVTAHMWYNIGAANGHNLGGEQRDSIAERMTPSNISQAQAMARECMGSGYQNCGY